MASKREERQLMRQRGAGTRRLIEATSGFTFGAPLQPPPSSRRTPKRLAPQRSSRKTPTAIHNQVHGTTSKAAHSSCKAAIPPIVLLPPAFVTSAVTGKRKRGRPPTKSAHGTATVQEVQDDLQAESESHRLSATVQKHSGASGSRSKRLKTIPLLGVGEADELEMERAQHQISTKKREKKRGRPKKPLEQQALAQREGKDRSPEQGAAEGTLSLIERPEERAKPGLKEKESEKQGTSSLAAEILDLATSDATQPPLKRKRGRPAMEAKPVVKRKRSKKQCTFVATEILDVSTSDVTQPPLKRRRGRPRKEAKADVEPPTVLHDVPAPKAIMSRHVAQGIALEQLPDSTDAIPQQSLEELKKPRRPRDEVHAKRRGRPRKQPVQFSKDAVKLRARIPGLGEEHDEHEEASEHQCSLIVQGSKTASHRTGKPAKQNRSEPSSAKETQITPQFFAMEPTTSASAPDQARRPLSDRTNTTSLPAISSCEVQKHSKPATSSKHPLYRNAISKARSAPTDTAYPAQPTAPIIEKKSKGTHPVKRARGALKLARPSCRSESGSDTDELSSSRYPPIPRRSAPKA